DESGQPRVCAIDVDAASDEFAQQAKIRAYAREHEYGALIARTRFGHMVRIGSARECSDGGIDSARAGAVQQRGIGFRLVETVVDDAARRADSRHRDRRDRWTRQWIWLTIARQCVLRATQNQPMHQRSE